ncbi:OLC1v1004859C1 [Oldenlandia corymbosa var. corymbosa]|uniref:OLC1v1004859C1 n=1 Tax=Oldenlandia corymbosa var. corymbosa TaxID=529605 RepID=A0AAV1DG81_OLDCO|nr:OLC1v1004859C1 [Oldenlandia corymbosa var. corymbosa]
MALFGQNETKTKISHQKKHRFGWYGHRPNQHLTAGSPSSVVASGVVQEKEDIFGEVPGEHGRLRCRLRAQLTAQGLAIGKMDGTDAVHLKQDSTVAVLLFPGR